MRALESWIVAYLLNSIWQLPLIFAAAWIAARLARPAGPRTEHRVWVGALIVETVLPACSLDLTSLLQEIQALFAWAFGSSALDGQTRVIVGPATPSGASFLKLPPHLMTTILAAYGCSLLYFTGRLAWGLWRTAAMLAEAHPLPPTNALAGKLAEYGTHPVHAAISPRISSPVTMGLRRHTLLLPPSFLDHLSEEELNAVLAHEAAHMRRHDFAKNLFYGALSLPVAYHPVLWLTYSRLAETREMVCDEMAADAIAGRETYARALLRLASMLTDRTPAKTLHAIGIFDANIFERRIMNLTHRRSEIPAIRRFGIIAAFATLAIAICTSALALHMNVNAPTEPNPHPKMVNVRADALKLVTQVPPVYPAEAQKAGIAGSVIIDALISKEGVPERLSIQKGPSALQKSALDAVRQWRWQPFLLNGDPIEVKTTLTVVYALGK
jgi:TonB family protein